MHKNQIWNWVFAAWIIIVFTISSSTTFAFFMVYFSGWIPEGLIDPYLSSLASGVAGFFLFDFAAVVWLYTFLRNANSSEQRGISLTMAIVDFFGAAAASVAYLGLTATGEMSLDAATKDLVGTIALIVVILGVVANFGASLAYSRFDKDTKLEIRESDRHDRIAKAQQDAQEDLDKEVARRMKQEIKALADGIVQTQSTELTRGFYNLESKRFETRLARAKPKQPPLKEVVEENSGPLCEYCGDVLEGRARKFCDSDCRNDFYRAKA